ncbi:MAG TPA: ice-binding family protein, partial [Ignavibacteriaceae bacterium]|nr:ice-binding family protein [Ignavibacteriaceae bacterium]
ELGAGEIGGLTLAPGLYKWSTDVLITTDVTLSGGSNDVWIFQIAGGITMANGKSVILTGNAQASNVFWQCFGNVSIGTTAHFEGIVLAQTAISLGTGASVDGMLLTQTAVTLDANSITKPSGTTEVETEFTPQEFALSQNYPNPFNPITNIQYSLEKTGMVSLKVYNLLGKEVATLVNRNQNAGHYTIEFNTKQGTHNLTSGVYFYRLEAESFVSVKKFLLLK